MDGFEVRSAVVVGEHAALVLDTLAHPREMTDVAALLEGHPFTVAYSHADWDHAWGTAGLPDPEGGVVAQEACAERFHTDVPATLAQKRAEDPERWAGVKLVAPTRTFVSRLDVPLGGVTVELHALPGHTPDSVVAFVPEWGILLAGDAAEAPHPFINERGALPVWIRGLERWAREGSVRTVVPSHGPVDGRELLERNIRDLRRAVAERTSEG